jgi:hypothetical protein
MSEAPKIIWSYWDSENYPDIVQACLNSWHKNLPDYKIMVLNSNTIYDYIKVKDKYKIILKTFNVALQTDYFRICLLEKYGGFWVDASSFINADLGWVQKYFQSDEELDIFYTIKNIDYGEEHKSWESFFLAARPKTYFYSVFKRAFEYYIIKGNDFDKFTPDECKLLALDNKYHIVYALHNYLAKTDANFKKQCLKQTVDRVCIYDTSIYRTHDTSEIHKLMLFYYANGAPYNSKNKVYKIDSFGRKLYNENALYKMKLFFAKIVF